MDRLPRKKVLRKSKGLIQPAARPLEEGRDFYWEQGLMVLTETFLLRRGYCCDSGCRHCPYRRESQTADL